ncbi:GNAT family N-acetyltransferase [Sporolactobacillus putidus]|uniref:N-acetyltransferase n=1 Tax=Sporolactobacillus putidus TaxID=492735 RepID=A0A917W3V3_9BACL|nr:GNAT family N-acetyltransferase [Sporolactobacillus putidus]GGL60708.1 N-acetyltransferase [Sporolactobacillus putidus]
MIVREMQLEDIPQLSVLYRQFWNEESDVVKMKKQFVKIREENTHILLSAIIENKLAGSVMGIVCEELYGDCKPFLVIENMIVDQTTRRAGVGRALLLELEKRAAERNCTQMILVTEEDRLDACSFYESYGFQRNNRGYKKKL